MEILCYVILGLLQGLTEFLPISSSGHLVLFGNILGLNQTLFVSIFLHLATLLSIVLVYRKDIVFLIKNPLSKQSINLMVATICTCVIALFLLPLVKSSFEGKFLSISFLISAVILFFAEKKNGKCFYSKKIDIKSSIIMGIAQGLAIFPGISRSGTTLSAGLYSNAEKESATKFSFLMSVPIIVLSLILEIVELVSNGEMLSISWAGLGLGFIVAFLVGIISIKIMIKLTKNSNLKYFSLYLCLISLISFFIL